MTRLTVLERITGNPAVESISDERRDGDGCWVYLHRDWICPAMECGTIHEDTWSKCLKMLRTIRRKTPAERKAAGYAD